MTSGIDKQRRKKSAFFTVPEKSFIEYHIAGLPAWARAVRTPYGNLRDGNADFDVNEYHGLVERGGVMTNLATDRIVSYMVNILITEHAWLQGMVYTDGPLTSQPKGLTTLSGNALLDQTQLHPFHYGLVSWGLDSMSDYDPPWLGLGLGLWNSAEVDDFADDSYVVATLNMHGHIGVVYYSDFKRRGNNVWNQVNWKGDLPSDTGVMQPTQRQWALLALLIARGLHIPKVEPADLENDAAFQDLATTIHGQGIAHALWPLLNSTRLRSRVAFCLSGFKGLPKSPWPYKNNPVRPLMLQALSMLRSGISSGLNREGMDGVREQVVQDSDVQLRARMALVNEVCRGSRTVLTDSCRTACLGVDDTLRNATRLAQMTVQGPPFKTGSCAAGPAPQNCSTCDTSAQRFCMLSTSDDPDAIQFMDPVVVARCACIKSQKIRARDEARTFVANRSEGGWVSERQTAACLDAECRSWGYFRKNDVEDATTCQSGVSTQIFIKGDVRLNDIAEIARLAGPSSTPKAPPAQAPPTNATPAKAPPMPPPSKEPGTGKGAADETRNPFTRTLTERGRRRVIRGGAALAALIFLLGILYYIKM